MRSRPVTVPPCRRGIASLAVLSLAAFGLSCSNGGSAGESGGSAVTVEGTDGDTTTSTTTPSAMNLPNVVVTYSVLGAFVQQLLADHADVTVLIPDGQDPHDFEPSPRDIERINEAVLVVANGLDLEEGLDDALTTAQESGVPVFFVADHVQLLDVVDVNDHSDHGHDHAGAQTPHSHDDDGHAHQHSEDPHVWLSPATMLEALPALVDAAQVALGVDLASDGTALAEELAAVDAELATLFDALDDCQLVTGHNELGYFAQRYGCRVIAAILASPSTTAEESAGNVEFVIDVIKTHGAKAVFTSLGTNPAVAKQVADAAGVKLVEINTHFLGDTARYVDFIRSLGTTIAESLG